MNPNDPDMTLGVEFFIKPVENHAKTREHGRAIFDDKEFIRIAFPGDSKREHVAPADEMHYHSGHRRQMTYAERFPDAYRAFKAETSDFVSGTPLTMAAFLTPSQREELKSVKIRTVEQLAGLPDVTIKKLGMGIRDLVNQAKAFLKTADGTSQVAAMQKQIDELKALLETRTAPTAPTVAAAPDPFEGMEWDDLFNMAQDAGLEPRANASVEDLKSLLLDAAKKKKAA